MGNFVKKVSKKVFGSKLGKIDPFLGLQSGYASGIKGIWDDISGKSGEDAANDAAALQYNATMAGVEEQRAARESMRKDLLPYQQMGTAAIPQYQQMLTPQGQQSYLQSNPMFQAAVNNAATQMKGTGAAAGKYNSGGMVNQLFQNYLGQGENFINSQYNRLYNTVGIGQNSAAMQGTNTANSAAQISNLYGQGANAMAAGQIGAANAQAQGTQNLMGLAGMAAAFFSDERLKEEMIPVGKDSEGKNLYAFRYKVENPLFVGYSAQEVAKDDPGHVMVDPASGFLKVSAKYAPKRVA